MQQFRRLTAMCAVAVVLVGCSAQESTRSGGLIAPTGPAVTATSPVPTVVTVLPAADFGNAVSSAATAVPSTAATVAAPTSAVGSAQPAEESVAITQPPLPTEPLPSPADGGLLAAQEVLATAVPIEGFREGLLGVTGAAGTQFWPVIVADTPQSRQRGLMGVDDFTALGGYAAMVFIFKGDTSGAFWMRDTPLPLRITFVAADGAVVSATDMVPCLPPTPPHDCEHYHPDGPYRIAIEHPLGPAFDIGLATAEFVEVTVE